MIIKQVTLNNFRNYAQSTVELSPGRNILIGNNAQGKTNFLEAIEVIAKGKSARASVDHELILNGMEQMYLELAFESSGIDQTISLLLRNQLDGAQNSNKKSLEKIFKLNGISQSKARYIKGKLVAVSFNSHDLNLLKGGPRFRRDWIDNAIVTLRPAFDEIICKYQAGVTQRNHLLRSIFEKGKVTVTDQEQLKIWDTQVAKFGAAIIQERMRALVIILSKASESHGQISGQKEDLSASYLFKTKEEEHYLEDVSDYRENSYAVGLQANNEMEIAQRILHSLKERRAEEIARKQTLTGPHRDDIQFLLDKKDAVSFASQGQQRSLVLSLKLAELALITEHLREAPILLLDDVFAELDLNRQRFLMDMVKDNHQTLVTTTHVNGFQPEWLTDALFLQIDAGSIIASREAVLV